MKSIAIAACTFLLLGLLVLPCGAASFTTIDVPSSLLTNVNGINSTQEMVGIFDVGQGIQGFLYTGGTFTTITYPGSSETFCNGINDAGDIVGSYASPATGFSGFIMQGQTFTQISVPGAMYTMAFGVNSSDEVVGQYADSTGREHGFLWVNGTVTTIDGAGAIDTLLRSIDTAGDIVGYALDQKSFAHGLIIHSNSTQTYFDVTNATGTLAWGTNDTHEIVGQAYVKYGEVGFVRVKGVYRTIVPFGSFSAAAFGVNNQGDIVGQYTDSSGIEHGFLSTP